MAFDKSVYSMVELLHIHLPVIVTNLKKIHRLHHHQFFLRGIFEVHIFSSKKI